MKMNLNYNNKNNKILTEEIIDINNILKYSTSSPSNSTSSTSSSSLLSSLNSNSSLFSTSSSSISSSNSPPASTSFSLFYEVYFKCSSDIFISTETYSYGDLVIVLTENGFNIGFIFREFLPTIEEFPQTHEDGTLFQARKILSKLSDDDNMIKNMLIKKIEAENFALNQCFIHMNGRKIGALAEIIGTEFQFDRKKLTIYIQFHGDVSVCRFVRKLYDIFKVRIKIINIDNPQLLYNRTMKYLHASSLNVTFTDIYKKESIQNIRSEFIQKKTQLLLHNNNNNNNSNTNNSNNNNKSNQSIFKSSSTNLTPQTPTLTPPSILSHQYPPRPTQSHPINERYSSFPHDLSNLNNTTISVLNFEVAKFVSTERNHPSNSSHIHHTNSNFPLQQQQKPHIFNGNDNHNKYPTVDGFTPNSFYLNQQPTNQSINLYNKFYLNSPS